MESQGSVSNIRAIVPIATARPPRRATQRGESGRSVTVGTSLVVEERESAPEGRQIYVEYQFRGEPSTGSPAGSPLSASVCVDLGPMARPSGRRRRRQRAPRSRGLGIDRADQGDLVA